MYDLACNPKVQDRLREEVDSVMSQHNGQLNLDIIQEMEYLEMVVQGNINLRHLMTAHCRMAAAARFRVSTVMGHLHTSVSTLNPPLRVGELHVVLSCVGSSLEKSDHRSQKS